MTLNELREACKHSNRCKRANHISNLNFDEGDVESMSSTKHKHHDCHENHQPCPQLPGTLLRVFIPAGATINLLNLIELTSPSGICLILRSPLLSGNSCGGFDFSGISNIIRQAGGTVEVVND